MFNLNDKERQQKKMKFSNFFSQLTIHKKFIKSVELLLSSWLKHHLKVVIKRYTF